MYCKYCGKPTREGQTLCDNCLQIQARQTGQPTPAQKPEPYEVNENSSHQIFALSNVFLVLLIVLSVINAIALCVVLFRLNQELLGIVVLIVVLVIGCIIAFLVSGLLRGFGELVLNSAETAGALRFLCKKQGGEPVYPVEEDEEEPVFGGKAPQKFGVGYDGARVICPFCGTKQPYGALTCSKCGVAFDYQSIQ